MKYQIVLLGSPWNEEAICKSIGQFNGVEFLDITKADPRYPLLYLYFGKSENDFHVDKHIERVLHEAVCKHIIQPIAEVP